ncbi:anaerobic ribonucleoside-triphosphate reductase activating protein [bacterium]|nr:anaerobic ribonucleoside-triphosphate reductase activating protein [bacterium]
MKIRLAGPPIIDSIVDGPGLRTTIFVQGCLRHCPGCHNPQTWDPAGGYEEDTATIKKIISEAKMQDGVTFSGGEPFLQAEPLIEVAAHVKKLGLNLWSFSGFKLEELQAGTPAQRELLRYLDVLVDGPFILAQRSLELYFKGSSNQRTLQLHDGQLVKQID